LAASYSFSGGQIENIARKRSLDAILNDSEPDFSAIRDYCEEERITDRRKPIGF